MSVRWLVIGIGDISTKRVIPAIVAEPRSVLAGVVTRSPEKGAAYATQVWPTLDAALAGDPSINAVYVATPVALHAPQTIASLAAGKHVLCEKPVALNYAEACRMRDAAKAAEPLITGIAYYRRTYSKLLRARELMAAGAIGRPVFAELNSHSWIPGFEDRHWLLDPTMSGGGPLYDIASHRIDLLNWMFGQPVRVAGLMSNVVHGVPVEDSATLIVDYASGARGTVDVRWHSREIRDDCRIIGTEGELRLSPLNGPVLETPTGTEHLPTHQNLHYPCVVNFVDAIEGIAPVAAPIEEAIWTDWVTEKVVSQNRPVPRYL
jgi:predicted dehydrogenase